MKDKIKEIFSKYWMVIVFIALYIGAFLFVTLIAIPARKENEYYYNLAKTYIKENNYEDAMIILEELEFANSDFILKTIKPIVVSEKIYELEDKSKENIEEILRDYYNKGE